MFYPWKCSPIPWWHWQSSQLPFLIRFDSPRLCLKHVKDRNQHVAIYLKLPVCFYIQQFMQGIEYHERSRSELPACYSLFTKNNECISLFKLFKTLKFLSKLHVTLYFLLFVSMEVITNMKSTVTLFDRANHQLQNTATKHFVCLPLCCHLLHGNKM